MTFEPVYQRTSSDCVVCCLAMYLGVSYEEARAMVQDHPGGGVCFNQAVEALRKRGRSARRSVYFFSGFPAILDLPSLNLVGRMHHAPESVEWHYPAAYAVCCVATAASDYGSAAVEAAVDALGLAGCAYRHFHGAERKIRG